MIPPSPAAAPAAPMPQVSARAAREQATPPSAEGPEPQYSEDIQRKIEIAKGRGLRRERPNTEAESGEQITLRGPNGVPIACKYCLANPCHGMSWVFEGQVRFKCDACGAKQRLGVTQEVADKTATEFEGMDRAQSNRNRAWREEDAKRAEEAQREMDELGASAEVSVFKDRGFVETEFLS